MARWRVAPVDEGLAATLAGELRLRGLTARVLLVRGLGHHEAATRFLTPRLHDLRLPEGIADLEPAVKRLESALLAGERIGVFGDYDVDGVTSAAVLTLTLRALGGEVVARVADRFSGYGFSPEEANRFADEGCSVVLTADCGTSDHEALACCRARGMDAVVIDHHQVPAGPSPAFALINPHRPDDRFSFKGLASCGVAFYLAAALRTRLRARQHSRALAFDPRLLAGPGRPRDARRPGPPGRGESDPGQRRATRARRLAATRPARTARDRRDRSRCTRRRQRGLLPVDPAAQRAWAPRPGTAGPRPAAEPG